MAFEKVRNGQDVVFRPTEWNAMLGAGKAYSDNAFNVAELAGENSDGVVLVKNTTGALRKRFYVMALDATLLGDDAPAFSKLMAFKGIAPDPENNAAHRSRVAILLKPLIDGQMGPALIRGQVVLPVDVIDTKHTRARVLDDGKLQSGYFGPVRILGTRSTGAATLCLCDVDGFDGGHCLIKVPEDGIPGGSWASPTTTECTLAWPHPSTKAATDVTGDASMVNVVNYGGEIEAAEGKYVHARIEAGLIIPDVEYCG